MGVGACGNIAWQRVHVRLHVHIGGIRKVALTKRVTHRKNRVLGSAENYNVCLQMNLEVASQSEGSIVGG
jgi:hypothetical protein